MSNKLNHQDLRIKLGKQLREARKSAGFTQVEASQLLGICREQMCKIEKGKGNCLLEQFVEMCSIYNLTYLEVADFVHFVNPRPTQ